MASMRDIKRRKDSIQSTQQITKAMKLVSTVKLQRARSRAENARPYFDKMYETIQSILAKSERLDHPFLTGSGSERKAVIVVTSNRGLAGGYNNNVTRLIVDSGWRKEDVDIYGVGRKGVETLARRDYHIVSDDSEVMNAPSFADAAAIGEKVLDAFAAGEIGEIYLAYTKFKNTVVHVPTLIRLLPVDVEEKQEAGKQTKSETLMNYEPGPEEALDLLIPKYINSTIFGAFIESAASENGARMQAMDAATSNAEEMISTLSLVYNRARQGAITQELTEIISGAEALNG
ncbi:ATP synthase gamma chain, sodium ion specific [Eubacteriaceae bacterium CHKCI004]|nr:ATP synthase gamma chain, sodium ion specific [Eubacteriaceae bacterium CHKCI004]